MVFILHFLQKHHIGLQIPDDFALVMQGQTGVEARQPFVDIKSGYAQRGVHEIPIK